VVEEWKWRGVPVGLTIGIICTETYKSGREADFRQGRFAQDPSKLFNSSLDSNTRRAIDLHEGDEMDEDAFQGR